jgi:hypothetical protein
MDGQEAAARLATGRAGTWSELVGSGWESYWRLLHPAYKIGTILEPVRWSQLTSPQATTNLANASWFDISGVRLHKGRSGDGWDIEPDVGPDDGQVANRALQKLMAEEPGCGVWVGQWIGYGDATDQQVAKADVMVNRDRSFAVHHFTWDMALGWLQQLQQGASVPLPNIAWTDAGSWMISSDVDLPSSIVGCTSRIGEALRTEPSLECIEIEPDAPIVG